MHNSNMVSKGTSRGSDAWLSCFNYTRRRRQFHQHYSRKFIFRCFFFIAMLIAPSIFLQLLILYFIVMIFCYQFFIVVYKRLEVYKQLYFMTLVRLIIELIIHQLHKQRQADICCFSTYHDIYLTNLVNKITCKCKLLHIT